MGVSLRQNSFAGGIVSPQLQGRSDQQKYAAGLQTCTNAVITRYGTIENRSGTLFDIEVKDSSQGVRLVPFIFSSDLSYLLEFGDEYVRPLFDGDRISVVGAAAYAAGTTYAIGELATSVGIVYYSIQAGNIGNTPASSPLFWYPQVGGFLEVPTNLPQAALSTFQYVQQADIMTITSQLIVPQQLQRFSHTRWAWVAFTQSTGVPAPENAVVAIGNPPSGLLAVPTGLSATGGIGTIDDEDIYWVSAWTDSEQSVAAGDVDVGPGIRATAGNPITVDWTASAGADGYAIYVQRASTGVRGLIGIVPDTVTIFVDNDSIDPVAGGVATVPLSPIGFAVFVYVVTAISDATGAESLASNEATGVGNTPSGSNPNVISWDAVVGASEYRIYRIVSGIPGFIGTSTTNSFNDFDIAPDTSIQPPTTPTLFATSDDYPAVCGFYQQRLIFANTLNEPQTMKLSRVGNYYDFSSSTPSQDNDSISITIAGRQVQEIRALIDLGKLVVHTSNAEYVCTGNQAGTLTPAEIGLVLNGTAGSTLLLPVVLGNTDLFVQDSATRLLDLRYEVQSFTYAGKDLTKFATDLFKGRTIVDLTWQKLPQSIVWCVLDNGQMVALTYAREDELWAWHLHESTNGAFENVTVVPDGSEFTTYVVVRREIDGATVRYIEHFAPRDCIDTVLFTDSYFSDSALVYDGRNTGATTVTASDITGWSPTDTVMLTASVATFVLGDVGNQIVFQQIDDDGLVSDQVSFEIVSYTSTTVVVTQPLRDVPTWAQDTALTTWGKAVDEFSGIDHLEGESLSILADGNVIANPANAALPTISVSGGEFALEEPALVVIAGLSLQMDVETLPLENSQGETIINKRVKLAECTPVFYNSRGGLYGQDADHLDSWKQPTTSPMGYPPSMVTGPYRVPLRGSPQRTGQIHVRLTDPVPWSISAIIATGEVGS